MTELRDFISAFCPIKEKTWKELIPLFSNVFLKKGDFFINDGEVATQIGFLQKGIIRAFYRTLEGVEYNKHFFKAPSLVGGYSSLITGQKNQIIQQALTDCHLRVADFYKFSRLYDSHPDLERMARKWAELHFVNKEQREIEIVLLTADKRYLIFQEQFPGLEQLIPQYHIASYLGVTPTQLSRIRKKSKEQ